MILFDIQKNIIRDEIKAWAKAGFRAWTCAWAWNGARVGSWSWPWAGARTRARIII
jgi:hypothetical protein